MQAKWTKQCYWTMLDQAGPMSVGSVQVITGRPRHIISSMLYRMYVSGYLARSQQRIGGTQTFIYTAVGEPPPIYAHKGTNDRPGRKLSGTCRLRGPANKAIDTWLGVRQT